MVEAVCWGPLTLGAVHTDAMDEGQVHVGHLAHEAGCLIEGLWGQARSGGRTPCLSPCPLLVLTHQGDVMVTGV